MEPRRPSREKEKADWQAGQPVCNAGHIAHRLGRIVMEATKEIREAPDSGQRGGERHMNEKERTARSALASWSRTARLCTIYIVSGGVPNAIVALLLTRH